MTSLVLNNSALLFFLFFPENRIRYFMQIVSLVWKNKFFFLIIYQSRTVLIPNVYKWHWSVNAINALYWNMLADPPVLREIIKMYFSPTRDELITFLCFIIFLKFVVIDLCLCLSCSLQSWFFVEDWYWINFWLWLYWYFYPGCYAL